jgi:ribosomal protein S18 acetylase RimI-like enzyme
MTVRPVPQVTLRAATADDEPFLVQVYCSSRADEMARVPWTEEERQAFLQFQFVSQNSYYRERFPDAAYEVILANGQPAGRLYTLRETAIRILDIAVLPEFRKRGIGSLLISRLVTEAEETTKAIQIYVEAFNPSLEFFEKRGFSRTAEDGLNYLLEYRPGSCADELH